MASRLLLLLAAAGPPGARAAQQQQQENFQIEVSWRKNSYKYYLNYEDLYQVPVDESKDAAL